MWPYGDGYAPLGAGAGQGPGCPYLGPYEGRAGGAIAGPRTVGGAGGAFEAGEAGRLV